LFSERRKEEMKVFVRARLLIRLSGDPLPMRPEISGIVNGELDENGTGTKEHV
jgi:hypothetical protein